MFLDKLSGLFRKNDGKEKLKTEYASPRNEYYAKVADRYGTVQMLLLVILTLFVIVALLINSEWITYENFYFFFSDFGDYLSSADSDIEDVVYDTGNVSSYAIYSGKLALVGDRGMKLYTPSGRVAIDDGNTMSNPVIETSDRYMMVYSSGGKVYSLYNLFTRVHTETLKYPIYGASAADNGTYAIITGDGEHLSCVKIYNRRFDEIQTIGRSSYTMDIALSPSGDRAALLSFGQTEGVIKSILYMTKVGKSKPYAEYEFPGSEPMFCSVTESGYTVCVLNDRIVSFNTLGDKVSEYVFEDGYELSCADVGIYGAAAVLHGNSSYIVMAFDRKGKLVYNNMALTGASDILMYDKYIFLDGAYEVTRTDVQTGKSVSVDKNIDSPAVMTVRSENEVLLCMRSRVRYIKF